MFSEIARKRRSIRLFTNEPVENEKIDQIVEAGLRSPSGKGQRPFHFVVITEKALIEKLAVAKENGGAFLKQSPLAIVICGDTEKSGMWVEDCSIAASTMQYAATSLGLGSCWGHMRGKIHSEGTTSRDYIAALLNLPDELEVLCVLGIGYGAQDVAPYKEDALRYDKVSLNDYGKALK